MKKNWVLDKVEIVLNGNLKNVKISVYRNKRNGKIKTIRELWVPGEIRK